MNNFFKQTVFFLFVLFTCLALGQVSASDIENPKSKSLDNWVSNPDGIISEEAVGTINGKINLLYDSTKAQIAVVIIKGDKMTSARDLSMDLFDSWKVGTKGMDNGLIILVVTESHQCFLRTGYGLEGCLTDALTSRIFSLKMKPYFKENQWEKGIINGLDACIEVIYSDFNE
ncbi:MAG: TPM domain-containing protein, partial [Bacteroidales bacterium]|nr:TPM domain-containing protein [Bacteroidales bacterium]